MKRPLHFLVLLLSFGLNSHAQIAPIKTEDAIYTIDGPYNFVITKRNAADMKLLFKTPAMIPDKGKGEFFQETINHADFELIGDNIVIVYDVWQRPTRTKVCAVKLLNINTGKVSEMITLNSVKPKNNYDLIYVPFFSPDKTKVAVYRTSGSAQDGIAPEFDVYDTKTFNLLSTKDITGIEKGERFFIDTKKTAVDNEGNIMMILHHYNEKTQSTVGNFISVIPFDAKEMPAPKEISDAETNASNLGTADSDGHFYKTMEDYFNDKPVPGIRIKNASYSSGFVGGYTLSLIDDKGNVKKESAKTLPYDLFTYKVNSSDSPYIIRMIDHNPYIILAMGKLNFYADYSDQLKRYISEGWDGKLKKFKENDFEDYLKKYGLLEDFKRQKPKREFRDDVNEYFNKIVDWQIQYFNLLNKKM